ncbi:MAG: hypothetical protein AB6733_24430 [Clostridiaceae bacterium]
MSTIKKGEFTFEELKCFLFKKKVCRTCGSKMKRISREKYVGMEWFRDTMINSRTYNEAYEVRFLYYCKRCNKMYTLEELAKKGE